MKEMFSNSYFWLCILLIVLSVIAYQGSTLMNGTRSELKIISSLMSSLGLLFGILRIIFISIEFEWYWSIFIIIFSLVIGGVVMSRISSYALMIISFISIIAIPIVWWFGGLY